MPSGNRGAREDRLLPEQHPRDLAGREPEHAQARELARALREGDARGVEDDRERDRAGEEDDDPVMTPKLLANVSSKDASATVRNDAPATAGVRLRRA